MNKSESIKEIATALCNLQAEIINPKNTADNPFFKSKYAPLNDILNDVRPLLSKHGLSILQSPSGNGSDIIVSSIIMHKSGEWIEPEPLILKADKPTAQGAGSAITYGRRYSISAILGISSEDDDDGNHAEGNEKPQKPQQQNKSSGNGSNPPKHNEAVNNNPVPSGDVISEAQAKRLFALAKGNTKEARAESVKMVITQYGYQNTKDIKKSDYNKISEEIESMPF